MNRLRDIHKFSPHARIIGSHTMGRAVMDIDGILINYARGFVKHLEFKWMHEREMDAPQLANIQMIADVWTQTDTVRRMYFGNGGCEVHDLQWKGFYIFRGGENDELTNDHPWQLVIMHGRGNVEEHSGSSGAVRALSDIARGAL